MDLEAKISLLYAEDEPQARTLLEKLLHHKFPGLTVYTAADGAEGIALYRKHRPQLIMTDIAMPVLDGVEMTKQIREVDPDAFIIALTAFNDSEFCAKSRELKFNLCITKPIEFKTLLDGVGDALEQLRKGHRAPAAIA